MTTCRSVALSDANDKCGWAREASPSSFENRPPEVDGEELVSFVGEHEQLEETEAGRRVVVPERGHLFEQLRMLGIQLSQAGMRVTELLLLSGVQDPAQLHRPRGPHRHPWPLPGDAVVQRRHSYLTIYIYLSTMQGHRGRVGDPAHPPKTPFVVQETEMHPWTMHRLAEERRLELTRAAARGRCALEARCLAAATSTVPTRRATRFLGELLIRTGWRLVGPDAPATGIRPRLALRASPGAIVDPVLRSESGPAPASK